MTATLRGDAYEIFYSYSHKDEDLRAELDRHLAILQHQGVIKGWDFREITAGAEWKEQIDSHLSTASIILLLISADFLASDYCYDIEMKRAMARHDAREALVIPVILRPVAWEGTPFGKLQALPKYGKAVDTWPNREEAFVDVAQGIRKAVEQLAPREQHSELEENPNESSPSMVETGDGDAAVLTTSETQAVEVVIDGEFDSFTSTDQEQLVRGLKELLKLDGPVRITKKRRGSVRLTLELSPEEADRLLRAAKAGLLASLGVVDANSVEKQGGNEGSLINRAVSGDADALAALLMEHAPKIRASLAGQIPTRWQSVLSVDDVVQQTYTDAFLGIARFDPDEDGAFSGWLLQITQCNLRDAIRMLKAVKRGGRSARVEFHDPAKTATAMLSMLSDSGTAPSKGVSDEEAVSYLDHALAKLPASYRLVVQLYDLEEVDVGTVAERLDRSCGAVYMLRARAHERLRELLGDSSRFFTDGA